MLNRQVVTKAKGTAILAVVLIHLLAVLPAKYYFAESIGLGAWILIFGQIILRFCVPLFLALSGYGLAKKYQGHLVELYQEQFRLVSSKRLQTLFFLLLFIALLIYAFLTNQVG